MRRRRFLAAVLAAALAIQPARAETLTVFAAASLKNALDAAATAYQAKSGDTVRISYAASSALARQIEAGAPADLFISADLAWMNYVETRKLIQPATRRNLLGNELVLVAPASSGTKIDLAPGADLASRLKNGPLAMADPNAVPAGMYGKAALTKLGIWDSVKARIARAADVRAALRLVARSEAQLGVVYRTDAIAEPDVEVAGVFPAGSYPPVIYPAALTVGAKPGAAQLLDFLASPPARPFFEKQGFKVLF
ncbi:MAG: molybdate ABC transporter substrate-binding protein [Alphaproteobacteria bacterium]|nr:molybdate ABC transporter substrate-binding protein [Alphaproteobacteria bacterium]